MRKIAFFTDQFTSILYGCFRLSVLPILFCTMLLLNLSGCRGSEALTITPEQNAVGDTPEAIPLNTDVLQIPTETPVLALEASETQIATGIESTRPATSYPDPLRFTFPTFSLSSSTIWRPPLYDTPWEPTPHDHFYFTRPIGADEINWPLAIYRYGGIFFADVVHSGIDIPAPIGTPVLAAGDGEVVWAGWGLYFLKEEYSDPYGLAIAIRHDFGHQGNKLYTVYGHMDEYYFVRGQRVKQGDMIGRVGETGQVTGPHLHFEVRVGENDYYKSRNPELWIVPPFGWGILAARILDSDGQLLEQQTINIRSVATNQYWSVITYGGKSVNSDPFYRENMVIGDLPAGKYVVWIKYNDAVFDLLVEIKPGMVTFFRYIGSSGFDAKWPPTPTPDFSPPDQVNP